MSDTRTKMEFHTPSPPASHSRPALTTTPASLSANTRPQAATPMAQRTERTVQSTTQFLKTVITPQKTKRSEGKGRAYFQGNSSDDSSNATEDTTPQQAQAPNSKGKGRAATQDTISDEASNAAEEIITPMEADLLTQITDLRTRDYMLMSDFSILRGEFRKAEFESDPNHRYSIEFRKSGLENFHTQFTIDEELKKLERYMKTFRKDRASNKLTPEQIRGSAIGLETQVLRRENAHFEEKKQKITNLRIELEKLGWVGIKKYYVYNLDIKYQIIGNQDIPPNAKSHRRRSVKTEPSSAKRKGQDSDNEFDATPSHPSKRGMRYDGSYRKPKPPPQSLSQIFPYLEDDGPSTNDASPRSHGSSTHTAQPNFLASRHRSSRPQGKASLAPAINETSDKMEGILHTQDIENIEKNQAEMHKLNAEMYRKQERDNKRAADESARVLEALKKDIEKAQKAKDSLR